MAAKSAVLSRLPPPQALAPRVPSDLERTFGDIAPVLVHDFKGPLSAVALNLDFVLEHLPPDASFDPARTALTECRHASERIFRVIANLLDVTRCEEGRMVIRRTRVSLGAMFRRVVAAHEVEIAQCEVRMHLAVPDDLPDVETDMDLFSRVMHNLLDNALRNARVSGNIVLAASADSGAMEIRIKNDGPAIPWPTQGRLFVRAVAGEGESMGINRGLGLYFCRLALESLGASISLAEEPGFPVCFVIRLDPASLKEKKAIL
jgi:K+-sensing histidine kinase KdpD